MDRDDNGKEYDVANEAHYDDVESTAAVDAEYAAQDDWDQPLEEFTEDAAPTDEKKAQDSNRFADEDEPLEDDYIQSEGDLEGQGMAASQTAMPKAQQSSNLMKYVTYAGGALAVAVLGFFGFQQFAGSSDPTTLPPAVDEMTQNQNAQQDTQQDTQQNTWDAQNQNAAPPNTDQLAAQNNMQQPVEQPVIPAPVMNPAPLPVEAASNPLEARIAELTSQLDVMKQTQDQLSQKLQEAQAAQAAQPSVDETSRAATQALQDRIAQLEQRLAQAASSPSTSEKTSTRNAKKASVDFMAEKKKRNAASAAKRKARPRNDDNASVTAQRFANDRPFVQGWILRSAQPGVAWLSQGPYSSDLRRVVPGDKVQGLGTITSIRQIAGRWVVEGTQGAIR